METELSIVPLLKIDTAIYLLINGPAVRHVGI